MSHLIIDTQLHTRLITRHEDTDYFIDTNHYPINLSLTLPYISRIQFTSARAVLVRTSPHTNFITLHVLSDTDLYSSVSNVEIDLTHHHLSITQVEGYIQISTEEVTA